MLLHCLPFINQPAIVKRLFKLDGNNALEVATYRFV